MSSKIQVILFRLSDPRKAALPLSRLLFALTLIGCNIILAFPSDGSRIHWLHRRVAGRQVKANTVYWQQL